MIFIKTNENGKVTYTHYFPFDEQHGFNKSREELELEGVLVNNIPEPETVNNQLPVLYYDSILKEFRYEYEDIPPELNDLELATKFQEMQGILNILLGED